MYIFRARNLVLYKNVESCCFRKKHNYVVPFCGLQQAYFHSRGLTYIIGLYNSSVKIMAQLVTPLMLCALILYVSGKRTTALFKRSQIFILINYTQLLKLLKLPNLSTLLLKSKKRSLKTKCRQQFCHNRFVYIKAFSTRNCDIIFSIICSQKNSVHKTKQKKNIISSVISQQTSTC